MCGSGREIFLSTSSGVAGMACLDKHVYIVCRNSNRVTVCNTDELDAPPVQILIKRMEEEMEEMEDPQDMVICPFSKLLYIADNLHNDRSSRLWIVDLSAGERIVKFEEFGFAIRSLAVTSVGLLMVPTVVKDGCVPVYKDGQKLEKIKLPCDVSPSQAFETTIGIFVAFFNDHIVQFMANGETVHCSGHSLGDARHVVFSQNRLLVLDGRGRRILVVNLQLKHELIISLVRDKVDGRLYKMCFDEKLGKIYVGTESGGRVGISVYDIAGHL